MSPIQTAIRSAPDSARAEKGFQNVPEAAAVTDAEQARILAALFSGSQAMTALLAKHPAWIQSVLTPDHLRHPRREQGLRREVTSFLQSALAARDDAGAFRRLREFRHREMLRIAARDLVGFAETPEVIREISDVADVCLDATLQLCRRPLVERLGRPYHQDADGRWHPTEFCVLGLGKLGGQELNYSSDVDVIFVYSEEGSVFKTPPRTKTAPERAMASHSFFKRLAESFIAEVGRATAEGALYRIDVRLRPEGDAGPLVRSLPGYENFYAQWGQTWERMMLIKARAVAGDAGLAAEFLDVVQAFRYPRSLGEGALREIAAMKARLESDVVRAGELDRDVKRGRGGIREIEFVVQTAQLLNAGRVPFLQGAQTLPMLHKLAQYNLLSQAESLHLAGAYCFLRGVEHRLQMEHNLQSHTLPADAKSRAWLAAVTGFASRAAFEAALRKHTGFVRATYEKCLKTEEILPQSIHPRQFDGSEAEWKSILSAHSFRDPDQGLRLLHEFASGPGYAHTSKRTTELAMELVPRFLALCPKRSDVEDQPPHPGPLPLGGGEGESPSAGQRAEVQPRTTAAPRERRTTVPPLLGERAGVRADVTHSVAALSAPSVQSTIGNPKSAILSDPDRVLARLDSFIAAYGARATLVEMWTHNPQLFELLLLLFDRSEFLAEVAIRTPDLVDDLVLSGRLRRGKTSEEILTELRHGTGDADQRLWLRRYHQAEFMRVGLRDILGLADYEQNFVELSALADACLQYALDAVARAQRFKGAPMTIVGLGKLGGQELNYGSDLDILFVAGDKAGKRLPALQKLAAGVMEMLSSPTELGIAFVTDARLRPDGGKGLLVNTLAAYEDYYRSRAQLWEIQALTRARTVAGDSAVGGMFQNLAATLTDFRSFDIGRPLEPPWGAPASCRLESRRQDAGAPSNEEGPKLEVEAPHEPPLPSEGPGARSAEPPLGAKSPGSRTAPSGGSALRRPACFTRNWKQEIARMRARIEKERTPAGQDALAFKTGSGGLIDAEFIAQSMCLEHGWLAPNTLSALQRVRDEGALPCTDAEMLIENFRQLRRVESILRRWSFEGEAVLPEDAAAFYRVSVRCGFVKPEAFRESVAAWRKAIREVYRKVFPA